MSWRDLGAWLREAVAIGTWGIVVLAVLGAGIVFWWAGS